MANLFRCAGAGGEDIKCIERPYNSNDIYNTGDTAMYNGLLRICTADGVTGEFDVSKWEVTTLDELLGENIGENDALVDYIASEYDPTHTYMTGDAILGDNVEILKCLEDEVTGEFDNSKWSRDYLCNLSGNVNSNLTSESDVLTGTTTTTKSTFYCPYQNQELSAYHLDITYDKKPRYIIISNDISMFETAWAKDGSLTLVCVDVGRIYESAGISGTIKSVNTCSFKVDGKACYINDKNARIPSYNKSGTLYYKLIY